MNGPSEVIDMIFEGIWDDAAWFSVPGICTVDIPIDYEYMNDTFVIDSTGKWKMLPGRKNSDDLVYIMGEQGSKVLSIGIDKKSGEIVEQFIHYLK